MCGAVQCEGIGWLFQMTNIENSAFKLVLSCGVVSLLNPNWRQELASHQHVDSVCLYYLQPLCRGYASWFFPLAFSDDGYNAENHS